MPSRIHCWSCINLSRLDRAFIVMLAVGSLVLSLFDAQCGLDVTEIKNLLI